MDFFFDVLFKNVFINLCRPCVVVRGFRGKLLLLLIACRMNVFAFSKALRANKYFNSFGL